MKKHIHTFNNLVLGISCVLIGSFSYEAHALKLPSAKHPIHAEGSPARQSFERIQKRLGKDLDLSTLDNNQQSVIAGFAETIKDQKALDDRIAAYLKDIATIRSANAAIASWRPLTTSAAIVAKPVTETPSAASNRSSGAAATLRLKKPGEEHVGGREGGEAPADAISPQVAAAAGTRATTKYVADVDPSVAGVQISYLNVDGTQSTVSVSAAAANKAAELTGNGLMAKVAEEMGANLIPDNDTVHVGGGRVTALVAEQLEAALKAKKDINDPGVTKAAYKAAIEVYVLGKGPDGKVKSLDQAAKDAAGPKLPGETEDAYRIRIAEKKAELEESIRSLCDCSGQC